MLKPSLCNRYTLRLYSRDPTEAEIADYLVGLDRFFRQERLRELIRLGWLSEQRGMVAPASPVSTPIPVYLEESGHAQETPASPAAAPVAVVAAPAVTAPLVDAAPEHLEEGPLITTEADLAGAPDGGFVDPLALVRLKSGN